MSIRIVTDSTADLPADIVERHSIAVVPLDVLFGDEALRDGIDITPTRFFERLASEPQLPTTSQPSPVAFREAYERLAGEGASAILSIHVGGKLSGTLESARQGARGLDVPVSFVDSGMTSLALGLGVVRAAELAEGGSTIDEMLESTEAQFERTHTFMILDTLEYLRRGGRLGRASEVVGTLLKVKPILAFVDGEVVALARVRTRSRAIDEALRRAAALRPIEQLMVVHAVSSADMELVADRLRALAPDAPMLTGELGAVVGVHAGPGTVAFAVVQAAGAEATPDPSPSPNT